jgi:hypothetical protein
MLGASETSINFYQTTRRKNPGDSNLCMHFLFLLCVLLMLPVLSSIWSCWYSSAAHLRLECLECCLYAVGVAATLSYIYLENIFWRGENCYRTSCSSLRHRHDHPNRNTIVCFIPFSHTPARRGLVNESPFVVATMKCRSGNRWQCFVARRSLCRCPVNARIGRAAKYPGHPPTPPPPPPMVLTILKCGKNCVIWGVTLKKRKLRSGN